MCLRMRTSQNSRLKNNNNEVRQKVMLADISRDLSLSDCKNALPTQTFLKLQFDGLIFLGKKN